MHLSMAGLAAADVDLHSVWVQVSETVKTIAAPTWAEVKSDLELIGLLAASVAAIGVLWRLPKIIKLVYDIRESRGRIWDLRQFSDNMPGMLEKMQAANADLPGMLKQMQAANIEMKSALGQIKDADFKKQLDKFKEQLDDVMDQLKEVQRGLADNSVQVAEGDQKNWDEVKNIWNDARDKLEDIIENADGRKTRGYEKMSRRDYAKIIDKLLDDGFINQPVADNAKSMNATYRSFMNRRNPISDNVKREFVQRKERFDNALLPLTPSESPSLSPITFEMPTPSPISGSRARTNGHHPPAG
jgi:hypothetical protein